MLESHICHVVSDTWSRSGAAHLVHRPLVSSTCSSAHPRRSLSTVQSTGVEHRTGVVDRRYTVEGSPTSGLLRGSPGPYTGGGGHRLVSSAAVTYDRETTPQPPRATRSPCAGAGRAGPRAGQHGKAYRRETNLPTQHAQAGEASWLPPSHVDARRTGDPEGETAQRASSVDGVSRRSPAPVAPMRRWHPS